LHSGGTLAAASFINPASHAGQSPYLLLFPAIDNRRYFNQSKQAKH
jgi:hypothetical protein